jgi:hypothetical protein
MADDVILNKAASIERCLRRIAEEYPGDRQNLAANQTRRHRPQPAASLRIGSLYRTSCAANPADVTHQISVHDSFVSGFHLLRCGIPEIKTSDDPEWRFNFPLFPLRSNLP